MIIDKKSTSDVLKQYQELGFDLTKSMIIEFFIDGSQKNLQSIESQIISYCKATAAFAQIYGSFCTTEA